MNKITKLSHNTNIRNTIFSEAGIGISGNSVLLLFHILMFIRGQRPRLTDMPIGFLALIHILMLLVMGLVATDIFMPWGRWDDITCKLVIFLYRLFRNLSLCATTLLSILQAITISPRSSCLAKFKHKSPYYMLGCLLFLSVFCASIGSHLLTDIIATPNFTSVNLTYITESCSLLPMVYSVWHTLHILLTLRDVIFIGLMALSSVYMVIFLCRHRKQSKLLHSTSLSLKSSPEQKATWTILCFMSFFVVFYTLESIISYLQSRNHVRIWYVVTIITGHIYPTVSPVLFLSTEKRIINILKSMFGRTVDLSSLKDG